MAPRSATANHDHRTPTHGCAAMREAAMAAFAKAGGGSKRRGWLAARFRRPRRLSPIKGLQWQTLVRGDIGRQRLFWPVANLPAHSAVAILHRNAFTASPIASPRKFEMTIPGVAGAVASAPLPAMDFRMDFP